MGFRYATVLMNVVMLHLCVGLGFRVLGSFIFLVSVHAELQCRLLITHEH